MIELPLSRGKVAFISDEDAELANAKWSQWGLGYVGRLTYLKRNRTAWYLHRVIMERMLGHPIPSGYQVDHINRDRLDNQRHNLRLASSIDNKRNRGKPSDNTSGFKGVYWHKQNKKWIAQISTGEKHLYLGSFITPEEAARAYNAAALKYYGEFAGLNDLDGEVSL